MQLQTSSVRVSCTRFECLRNRLYEFSLGPNVCIRLPSIQIYVGSSADDFNRARADHYYCSSLAQKSWFPDRFHMSLTRSLVIPKQHNILSSSMTRIFIKRSYCSHGFSNWKLQREFCFSENGTEHSPKQAEILLTSIMMPNEKS